MRGCPSTKCGEQGIRTLTGENLPGGLAIRCNTIMRTLLAEVEGLEPPRAQTRRFSRPLSYQLELNLQFEKLYIQLKRYL